MASSSASDAAAVEKLMREALLDQYCGRFGPGASKEADVVSLGVSTIGREVDHLMGASVPVTESNVLRLERRLQRQAHVVAGADADSLPSVSAYTARGAGPGCGSRASSSRACQSARGSGARLSTPRGSSTPGRGSTARAASTPRPRSRVSSLGTVAEHGGRHHGPAVGSATPATPAGHSTSCRDNGVSVVGSAVATASSLEWGVLDRLAGQMQKHDAEVHRAREQELRKRLRQDLDRQVEDAHLKQEREREEALRYHEMQQSALQQWKQEEEANAKAMKALRVHNSQAHTEQMDRMRSQRERRLQEEMRDAQAAVDAHHRDTELQRLQAADRWNHRREIAQEALAVSNASVKIRDEMRRRQEDIEQQSVEAHQRQLQKREQDMKQQHVRQQEVLEAKYAAASEVLAATKLKPPGDDDLREEATRSALYAKRELEDRRRAASIRADTQAYQVEQMRQKATAKQKEADLKQQIRTSQEREVKDHLEGLRMKSRERRVLNLAHRVELERQMLSKTHGAPKGDTMTEAELRINRDLLEKVNRALGGVPPSSAGTAR